MTSTFSTKEAKVNAKKAKMKHWVRNWPGVEVVGESYYHETFEHIVNKCPQFAALTYLTLSLVPESNNEHDANAVAVHVDSKKIGHLSRTDAGRYRDVLRDEASTADGVITGGLVTDAKAYSYSVQALLNLNDAVFWSKPSHPTPLSMTAYSVLISGGNVASTYVAAVSPQVADMCEAGDELAVWFKEERNDVFLFARGSLAGSGRVAVIEAGDLAKLGIPRQHLRAFVKDAGRHHVLVEFVKLV